MQKELTNLVIKYANNNQKIDTNFINKTIKIASSYYELDKYILENFNSPLLFCEAGYIIDTKIIITNLNSILKDSNEIEKESPFLKQSKAFKYLYCIHVLLHEIEHAKQQKTIYEENIESKILHAEFNLVFKAKQKNFIKKFIEYKKQSKLRTKFYTFSPSERLAEIRSLETSKTIAKLLQDEMCYDYMLESQLYNLIRGYNVGLINYLSNAPTKYYLQQVNPNYNFNELDILSKNLNTEKSIELGLQVEKNEIHKIAEESKNLILKLNTHKYH